VNRSLAGSSNVADLSGLALSNITLSPAFDAGTTNYKVIVDNDIASVTVTPTAADNNAALTVNAAAVTSHEVHSLQGILIC
jgi:hypothetical protein